MTDQLNLRTFTVVKPRAPVASPGVVLLSNGCGIAVEPLTPEQRDAAQRAMYRPKREAAAYTRLPHASRAAVFRSRLMGLGARPGATAIHVAGRLLRDHGDDARQVLAATWRPDWGVVRSAVDGLLSRAGVPS